MTLTDTPLDELTVDAGDRPKAPPIPGATDADRQKGRHLAMIHAHYLSDMAQIARLMARIEAGEAPPTELADIVLSSDMAQNLRAFGSICGRECQVLMMHHDIEQAHMFPGLEAVQNEGLRAVVTRLRAEHEVVHELLNRLAYAAQALGADATDTRFDEVRAIYAKLFEVVRSHFRYEETELEEAIGVYLGGV